MKIFAVKSKEMIAVSAFASGWTNPVQYFDEAGNPLEVVLVDSLPEPTCPTCHQRVNGARG